MVDTETIASALPHYGAMLLLAILAVTLVRVVFGIEDVAIEFATVFVVVFLYPFAVRQLGYAPDHWA